MPKLKHEDVLVYVKKNIGAFHSSRISSLENLKLSRVLSRKNPYLFRAKNVSTAAEIVKGVVDAHLSSNEETLLGDWLEGLAIFINQKVYRGRKSGIPGIDLEFDKQGIRYIVNIKSGPNWGNSSQIKKLKEDFRAAIKTLRTSGSGLNIIAINGCCYGRDRKPDKGLYFKYCGQQFWEFISTDSELYLRLIQPLGHQAKQKNEAFHKAYARLLNKFTRQFIEEYCTAQGEIDWDKLMRFNSAIMPPRASKTRQTR